MRYLGNYLDIETNTGNFGMDVNVDNKNMPLIEDDSQAEELAKRLNADLGRIHRRVLGRLGTREADRQEWAGNVRDR